MFATNLPRCLITIVLSGIRILEVSLRKCVKQSEQFELMNKQSPPSLNVALEEERYSDRFFVESCSPRTQIMLGFLAEELVGRHMLCLFAESKWLSEYDSNDCAQFMESFYEKTQDGPVYFSCLRKDGEDLHVDIVASEFNQQEGLRYMVHLIDVSNRHRNTKAG